MGLFLGLSRLSTGTFNYKARLERVIGSTQAQKPKKERKRGFSLGIGESRFAARVDKAVGKQTYGRAIQQKLAQADLKLTLTEFMLIKFSALIIGALLGLYLGRGGSIQQVLFGVGGIVVGFF